MLRTRLLSLPAFSCFLAFAARAQFTYPDANSDGRIDLVDANVLAVNFGYSNRHGPAEGDFNNDGQVDSRDLNSLVANYGTRSLGLPPPTDSKIDVWTSNDHAVPWQLVPVQISAAAIANDPQLSQAKSYDVMISTFYPLTAAGLNITLSTGTFYTSPLRTSWFSTRATDQAILANPALEYDTCVGTRDAGYSDSDVIFSQTVGQFPALPGAGLRGGTRLSVSWVQLGSRQETGTFSIARLTVLGSSIPPDVPEPLSALPLLTLIFLRRQDRKALISTNKRTAIL